MSIKSDAKKDAKRFAKAKMNYGDGAGVMRRHLNAELYTKMQNDAYKEAFDEALGEIDYDKIVKTVKAEKHAKNMAINGKKALRTGRTILGLVAAATAAYPMYSKTVDDIAYRIKKAAQERKDRKEDRKVVDINRRKATMTDREKANAYLRSVGIDAYY